MRARFLAASALAVSALGAAWAQAVSPAPPPKASSLPEPAVESGTLASIPPAMLGEALTLSIVASVSKPASAPSWEARDFKYTIPGSSVSVKMLGREVVIVITVTPYKNKDGGLLLVAQGQVWYKDGDSGLRYRTTVDTLSVAFGERVLYYPFGSQADTGAPLRVELVMDRYQPAVDGESEALDAAKPPVPGAQAVQPQPKEKAKP